MHLRWSATPTISSPLYCHRSKPCYSYAELARAGIEPGILYGYISIIPTTLDPDLIMITQIAGRARPLVSGTTPEFPKQELHQKSSRKEHHYPPKSSRKEHLRHSSRQSGSRIRISLVGKLARSRMTHYCCRAGTMETLYAGRSSVDYD